MFLLRQALFRPCCRLLAPNKCQYSVTQVLNQIQKGETKYKDSEVAIIKRNFDKVDIDFNYEINMFQFNDFIQLTMGRSLGVRELRKLFEEVDKDKDGMLSFNDVLEHMNKQFSIQSPQRIKDIFCLYDRDGDGQIELHELREILFHLGYFVSRKPELEALFNSKDPKKLRTITFYDFEAMLKEDIPKLME